MDTIVALSTPPGRGGIGVVRISGKLVSTIAPKLLGKIPKPRKAEYLSLLAEDGSILEKVIALFFPAPNSFTGENVLEIHGHGGQIILDLILERILKISPNIRLANPGEFTERAFLNEKIDLIQAEAIADIIDANSYQAAKSASNSLQGAFSKKITAILEKIIHLRMYVESSIDFTEEAINTLSYDNVQKFLKNIIEEIKQVQKSARYGVLLREGIKIVIAGKTNVGKSSLFNALIELDRAIISTISGTTRDTLCECIQLQGIAFYITDTAGLKKNSDNEVEKIGMKRTWNKLNNADHILWIVDSNDITNKDNKTMISSIEKEVFYFIQKIPVITIIRNKSDLSSETVGITTINDYTIITVSALLNDGIDLLREHLIHNVKFNNKIQKNLSCCINNNENQGNFIARRRHLDALEKSYQNLISAQNKIFSNTMNNNKIEFTELFAEDLRLSHYELSKIFGKFTSDDLLKKIFSTFCIGK